MYSGRVHWQCHEPDGVNKKINVKGFCRGYESSSSPSPTTLQQISESRSFPPSSATRQQKGSVNPSTCGRDMSMGLSTSSLIEIRNFKKKCYDRILGLVSTQRIDKDGDNPHTIQHKSRLQLILLSCVVCGIDFCYSAQTAFVSPFLLRIGLPATYMTLVWCLSPFCGFFLIPLLGSLSDRCQSPLGRRRPFILLLSVGIILGLLLVPHGQQLGALLGDQYPTLQMTNITNSSMHWNSSTVYVPPPVGDHPWGIFFTVLGVVLLDFHCDACQSPCRAYLLDVTVPEDHSMGLTTFTVMAGLGSSVGYAMGSINWQTTKMVQVTTNPLIIVFTLVLIMYVIFLILTINSTKEVPLSKLESTKEDTKIANKSGSDEESETQHVSEKKCVISPQKAYGTRKQATVNTDTKCIPVTQNCPTEITQSTSLANNEMLESYQRRLDRTTKPALKVQAAIDIPLPPKSDVSLNTYLLSIVNMPKSLVMLCITNVFGWMSYICYALFFTDFVGQAVFGGVPLAPPWTKEYDLYGKGVRTGCMGMTVFSLTCAVYSLCIERLVNKFSARSVYIVSHLVYTFGALVMATTRNRITVIVFSPCTGIMYATLFTMPYIILARYHSTGTFEEQNGDVEEDTRHKTRGLGTDIAVVSSMLFVAQFVLSACMGAIVDATGTTASVMAAAAILSFLGACTATQVMYLDL